MRTFFADFPKDKPRRAGVFARKRSSLGHNVRIEALPKALRVYFSSGVPNLEEAINTKAGKQ